MQVGIVGAGLIGTKRAEAVGRISELELVLQADLDLERAASCCAKHGGRPTQDWHEVVRAPGIDLVIVATQHDAAVPIAIAALQQGKHVLCEKPLGRNAEESLSIVQAAEKSGKLLKAGFNYRYYPHVMKAKQLIDAGYIGELKYVKAVLGHAARPGYEQEWRVDAKAGGGGALLDPGIHLVDLSRYFLGDFVEGFHSFQNAYWDMAFEDNAFVLMKTADGRTASIHASITEWKNTFSLDLFGTDGFVKLQGRGGFYGKPRIAWNKRWAWLNGKDNMEKVEEFDGPDESFLEETVEFVQAINELRLPNGSGYDALAAARFIDAIYAQGGNLAGYPI